MDEELNEPLPYWDWTQEGSGLPRLWSELRNAVLTDLLVWGIWLNVDLTHVSMYIVQGGFLTGFLTVPPKFQC